MKCTGKSVRRNILTHPNVRQSESNCSERGQLDSKPWRAGRRGDARGMLCWVERNEVAAQIEVKSSNVMENADESNRKEGRVLRFANAARNR